ncbi:MAG: zinc-ribbon domain-containing protein [Ruminococcus sp.]|nr:zinc-ribbon domain-containing protein [Ruminococcus sp.]
MAKQNKKYFDKKLCDAGIGSVLLCVFAFVFGGAALLLEPIGYGVHSSKFDIDIGLFSGKPWYNYMIAYDKHIIITLIAFAAMLICIRNRSRKKIGAELGIMVTFSALALCLISAMALLSAYDNGLLSKSYAILNSTDISQDFKDFDRFMAMLYYLLPLLASSLLFIAGLLLWGRCATEEFKVKCPAVIRVVEPMYTEPEKPAETAPTFEYGSPEAPATVIPAAPEAVPVVPATSVPEAAPAVPETSAPAVAPMPERPYNPFSQIEPKAVVPPVSEPTPEEELMLDPEMTIVPDYLRTSFPATVPEPAPVQEAAPVQEPEPVAAPEPEATPELVAVPEPVAAPIPEPAPEPAYSAAPPMIRESAPAPVQEKPAKKSKSRRKKKPQTAPAPQPMAAPEPPVIPQPAPIPAPPQMAIPEPPVIPQPVSEPAPQPAVTAEPPMIREDAQPTQAPTAEPQQQATRFCSSCGHKVGEGARFCPSCGNKLF